MFIKDGHASLHSRTVPGMPASVKPGKMTQPAIPRTIMTRWTEPGIPIPRRDEIARPGVNPVVVRRLSNYVHTDVEPEVILLTRKK